MSNRTLMQSQSIAVNLCLQVITKDESGGRMSTLPILRLTPLLFWLWSIRQRVNQLAEEVLLTIDRIAAPLLVMGKVVSIGFTSLAWGMGVRL
jgi:hypothetical protein